MRVQQTVSFIRRSFLRCVAAGVLAATGVGATGLAVTAAPSDGVGPSTLAAYVGGTSSSPICPVTTVVAEQCDLATALGNAVTGGTITLESAGDLSDPTTQYVGNFEATVSGSLIITSANLDAPAILSGNGGQATGCSTSSCAGSTLTIDAGANVTIDAVDFANAMSDDRGGAVTNNGDLTVSASVFTSNTGIDGGAIDAGDATTADTTIIGSSFTGNQSGTGGTGGAIDNADNGGDASMTISGSLFSQNDAASYDGGAVDNADDGGTGSLAVSDSSFQGNIAAASGGAIDSCDFGGAGDLVITGSSFDANSAGSIGGAVSANGCAFSVATSRFTQNSATDNGGAVVDAPSSGTNDVVDRSTFVHNSSTANGGAVFAGGSSPGRTTVDGSSFDDNSSGANGGAIDSADGSSSATLSVSDSLFAHNVATLDGGAIDNANESSGDVSITDTTFAENSASADGGAIANASHGSGSMDVTSSTFAANAASTASALDNAASGTGSMLLTADLLVSSVGPACAGTISDGGYNVADTSSCVFSAHSSVNDSSSIDGYVSPLGLYGGPTETVALLGVSTAAGSSSDPALGRVSSTALVPSNTESVCSLGDQRGEPRSTTCDAGAFELHASHGILGTPAVVLARAPNTISLTITPPPGLPATFPDLAGWSAPSGEVSVSDGASSCTTTLTSSSNGLASCRLSGLRLGASMVRVSYAGDENFTPWSLTKRVVARSGTSATLTLSARSVVHGKENHERFSVHVRAAAGAGTPDGSVHVMAGTTTLCSLTLVAGVGVCSPSSARVAASTYMVTAVYPGTSTWAPSHSSSENWKVTP